MKDLLFVYQAFPTSDSRTAFLQFCELYFETDDPKKNKNHKLARFASFHSKMDALQPEDKTKMMAQLSAVFQSFPTEEARELFTEFCNLYIMIAENAIMLPTKPKKIVNLTRARTMAYLLPIYKHRKENVQSFIQQQRQERWYITDSYGPRTYLRYMRSVAALQAELNAGKSRIQSAYETGPQDQLPVLWTDDPFIQQAQATAGFANAHDFESIYEQDFNALVTWCKTNGYVLASSPATHTIYNGDIHISNYHTTYEVEDFITYLDTTIASGPALKLDEKSVAPARIVSLIKKILGLEQKSGQFEPYLGHSMFYARPDSPKGDEVLGRVWFMMKKTGEGKSAQDAEDYKKSVVLAILESAEISERSEDTHCQTRITGELMKAIVQVLPDSKLRQHIAAEEPAIATTDQDIVSRIDNAPIQAKLLFDRIHREDTGEVRKLRELQTEQGADPELWELYQAYYDDLYQRTKNPDGTYRLDANTLTRDDHGNLVKAHLEDGSARSPAEVQIVYHQAEFQVLEQAFTEYMRKEFEEQRGLKY
jgi:hypothetical protein